MRNPRFNGSHTGSFHTSDQWRPSIRFIDIRFIGTSICSERDQIHAVEFAVAQVPNRAASGRSVLFGKFRQYIRTEALGKVASFGARVGSNVYACTAHTHLAQRAETVQHGLGIELPVHVPGQAAKDDGGRLLTAHLLAMILHIADSSGHDALKIEFSRPQPGGLPAIE
jgi:hypothetical protein